MCILIFRPIRFFVKILFILKEYNISLIRKDTIQKEVFYSMDAPKISVIVPIYNVQQYLEECLDSLVQQTFTDIEVIMVNDGSTDNSGKIMHRYAEQYNNFFAYDKPNGGLGQARNYGVEHSRGEYIAFVDSDDVVDKEAYEKMYKTVKQTGSDMAIGNVMRFNSQKRYASSLHQKVFFKTKLKAHITRDHELIYDTTAWNKLYRRSFWMNNNFKFPEGMLYEDIPVTFPAHYLANSVDVLDDIIYYWRSRDLGDQSITQSRTDINNLIDRFKAVEMLNQFFEENHIEGELKEEKDFKILNIDLKVYLNKLTEADDTFISKYIDEVSRYLEAVHEISISKLWPVDRMKYYFVKQKDVHKLLDLLKLQQNGELKKCKLIKKNGHYYINYPYKDLVPESYLLIDDNLKVKRRTVKAQWEEMTLKIKGYCFIEKMDIPRKKDVTMEFFLCNEETDDRLPIQDTKIFKRPNSTYKFGVPANQKFRPLKRVFNYDWSGFELSINFNVAPFNDLPEGQYYVQTILTAGGIRREFRVGSPAKGKNPRPRYTNNETTMMYAHYNGAWDFIIHKEKIEYQVTDVRVDNRLIHLTCMADGVKPDELILRNMRTGERQNYPVYFEQGKFTCSIPVEALQAEENYGHKWKALILTGDSERPLLIMKENVFEPMDLGFAELKTHANHDGSFTLSAREYGGHLQKITLSEGHVSLSIAPPIHWKEPVSDIKIQFASKDNSERHNFIARWSQNEENSPSLQVDIDLLKDFNEKTFIHDKFDLKIVQDKPLPEQFVIYTDNVKKTESATIDRKVYQFNTDSTLSLSIKPTWSWFDKGALRREALRTIFYPLVRLLPLKKKTIIFESYWGKNYECNPRALYEYIDKHYPEFETIWSLKNPLTHIEGKGKKVRMHSLKYFYYMARAKYFVNNVNFPDFYQKRKGAVELQTMHGTPLKTLGLDAPGEIKPGKNMEKFLEKNRRWDYLCVPSDYVANIAEKAFAHRAKVLNSGYPRNDKLFNENTPERINEIKSTLGIPSDKKVIFYAPTWRVRNKFKLELDILRLKEQLSKEYILLVKFHHYVANAVNLPDEEEVKGFLYDLSSYNDIRDLYLISDVLITDYSSVMFDYAILDRPMIFFTYDLEMYRDNLRGMYFDLIEKAPGPVCLTNDELIDEILNLKEFRSKYGEKLDTFRKMFNQYDKGNASEQIFNVMFKS